MVIEARVTGIPDLKAELASIVPKLRKRALRNALAAGARIVQKEARAHTPVLKAPIRRNGALVRQPGTVRKAISVRTSKVAARAGNVGVFVNVRPAKGAVIRGGKVIRAKQKGANSPNDPFYWQWLNFGRQARAGSAERKRLQRNKQLGVKGVRRRRALRAVGAIAPYRFLERGAGMLPAALQKFVSTIGPQIQRLNRKGTQL